MPKRLSLRARWRIYRALPGVIQAGVALGFLILFVLILFPSPAKADAIFRAGADWVRITALPCSEPAVLALLEKAGQDAHDWRAADAQVQGQPFAACWRPDFPQRVAHVVYGDGDQGLIPFDLLQPLKDA